MGPSNVAHKGKRNRGFKEERFFFIEKNHPSCVVIFSPQVYTDRAMVYYFSRRSSSSSAFTFPFRLYRL